MAFCWFGQAAVIVIFSWDFLKLLEAIDMDGSFPMSRCM
jgi:hypothetical protein